MEADNINIINYQLVGIVEKLKDEYISFIKEGNIWISSQRNQISFNEVKQFGTIVALFYYSEDNNLSIENQEDINLASINLDDQIFVDQFNFTINTNNHSLMSGNNINLGLNRQDNNMQQFSGFGNISGINNNSNNSIYSNISNSFNVGNINNNIYNQQLEEQGFTDNQLSGFFDNPQQNNIYNNNINQ